MWPRNIVPLKSAWASVIKSESNQKGADITSIDVALETKAYEIWGSMSENVLLKHLVYVGVKC
jgi:hypothetical protein